MHGEREPTYQRLLLLLGDHAWHLRAEVDELTEHADSWIEELEESGHRIERDGDRVRLAPKG